MAWRASRSSRPGRRPRPVDRRPAPAPPEIGMPPDARQAGMEDPNRVTVYAPQAADAGALLRAIGPYGTGDLFCSSEPPAEGESADTMPYCATFSDTVATFVIEATQDPLFGGLPPAVEELGWTPAELTAYEISVPETGPGARRLRYRLAKSAVEVTGGVAVDAEGSRLDVESLADPTWGSLW